MSNIFKQTIAFLSLLIVANVAMAQAPQGIPYQAVARNSSGVILASQAIRVRFTVHDATAGGAVVYQETFNPTTTALGLFNVNVGTGTVVSGTFSGINWGTSAKYMQVEMDPAGGTSYVDMGTQQMMSVPYALYSNNGVSAGTTTGDMLYWNGSSWVRVPAGSEGQLLRYSGGAPQWQSLLAITTDAISSITANSATSGGTTSTIYNITASGVCWSTATGPTATLSTKTNDAASPGHFTSNITGLAGSTTYYVRAYVIVTGDTAYGNEVSFTTPFGAGSGYEGGTVVYVLQPGDPGYDASTTHGLIAATADLSSAAQWGCSGLTTGATGTAIGTGATNTATILSTCTTSGIAAQLCHNYNGGGYNDWYLPSLNEFNKIYISHALLSGLGDQAYWTSSEASSVTAWWESPVSGTQFNGYDKSSAFPVRAVRSF